MHYPGHTGVQFFTSSPAPEPNNIAVHQGAPASALAPAPTAAAPLDADQGNVQAHRGGGEQNNQNPIQMIPRASSADAQYYCRQLDGSYSLYTGNKIMRECQPGYWKHGSSGYPYWVRTAPS